MKKSNKKSDQIVEETVDTQAGANEIEASTTEELANETLAETVEAADVNASLYAELEAAKARAQEATDQYLRLMAEFDNFRKRSRREYESLQEYASEKVLTALLTVLDDFDRTLTAMEKTDNLASIKEGITLVTNKLHHTLSKEGLNLIDTDGADFDSGLHEAIHSIEVPDEKKGKVLEQAAKGYRLKDKVIRYAKVIVGE